MTVVKTQTPNKTRSVETAGTFPSFHQFGSVRHGSGEPTRFLDPQSIVAFERDGSYSVKGFLDSGQIVNITWFPLEEMLQVLIGLTAREYIPLPRNRVQRELFLRRDAIKGYFRKDTTFLVLLSGTHSIQLDGFSQAVFEQHLNEEA